MGALSKLYQEHIQTKSCQSLLLHSESCRMHLLKDVFRYTAGNFKHFAPFCLLPLIIKIHSMDKTKLRKALEYYVECSLTGSVMGYTIDCCICLFRNLLGHFGIYTFVFLPVAIGTCMLNFSSARVINLFETNMYQCSIETFFLMRRFFIGRLISDSRLLQTYIFMLCSAIILQGKHLYNFKGFWLLKPNPKVAAIENREDNECELHPKVTCQKFLFDGMRQYFLLGLTLDIVKTLMAKVAGGPNESRLLGKIKSFRIHSTTLLTVYIGIYRFTHCFLNRRFPAAHSLDHISSGFLAGICYYFYPQSTLFSYALVRAIGTIWKILQIENANTKNIVIRFLLRFPFCKIVFPFLVANSVHLVCLKPKYASQLSSIISNGITNNYAYHIKNLILKLKQNINEEILQTPT